MDNINDKMINRAVAKQAQEEAEDSLKESVKELKKLYKEVKKYCDFLDPKIRQFQEVERKMESLAEKVSSILAAADSTSEKVDVAIKNATNVNIRGRLRQEDLDLIHDQMMNSWSAGAMGFDDIIKGHVQAAKIEIESQTYKSKFKPISIFTKNYMGYVIVLLFIYVVLSFVGFLGIVGDGIDISTYRTVGWIAFCSIVPLLIVGYWVIGDLCKRD